MPIPCVALISLEPWDDVWRRNQYFTMELLRQRLVGEMVFVDPPVNAFAGRTSHGVRHPLPDLTVVTPVLRVPKRAGGLALLGAELRALHLRNSDIVWVNDPTLGVHCFSSGRPAVYDVTDDWRWVDAPYRIWRRIIRAEDRLARRARTVVCSEVLRERWHLRYGVHAHLVNNGIDLASWQRATPRPLPGKGPHIGYVGTLHAERLDLDLLAALAADPRLGTVHLVGPSALPAAETAALQRAGVRLHGSVPPEDVPDWSVSFDVLVCPHLVTPFTRSLDAIKSYEYVASGRPVVATPTSGFQDLHHPSVAVVEADRFVDAVAEAATRPATPPGGDHSVSWAQRAREFAGVLGSLA